MQVFKIKLYLINLLFVFIYLLMVPTYIHVHQAQLIVDHLFIVSHIFVEIIKTCIIIYGFLFRFELQVTIYFTVG